MPNCHIKCHEVSLNYIRLIQKVFYCEKNLLIFKKSLNFNFSLVTFRIVQPVREHPLNYWHNYEEKYGKPDVHVERYKRPYFIDQWLLLDEQFWLNFEVSCELKWRRCSPIDELSFFCPYIHKRRKVSSW